jgi:O-antigen ligase
MIRVLGGTIVLAGVLLAFVAPLHQTCATVFPPPGEFFANVTQCYASHMYQMTVMAVASVIGLPLLCTGWWRAGVSRSHAD